MKSALYHLGISIGIGLLSLVGYGMWYGAISDKSAAVVDLQNAIDIKTETVSRIASARATLASIENDEVSLRDYFIPEENVVMFIDSLETRGERLGAALRVLSVSTSGTVALPSLTLLLSIAGTFDAVMRTVGSIEYAPYDISISKFSITRDDKNNWRADLTLVVGSVPAARAASGAPSAELAVRFPAPSSYASF